MLSESFMFFVKNALYVSDLQNEYSFFVLDIAAEQQFSPEQKGKKNFFLFLNKFLLHLTSINLFQIQQEKQKSSSKRGFYENKS